MTQDNSATTPEPVIATPEGGTLPEPAAAPTSIATGNVPDVPQAPADFPEDWRAKLSGGDEKEMKRLERFGSPNDVYKAYREIEKKLSSGTVKQELPKDPTPEQLTEWRKTNGIPETPEGYDTTVADIVIGENDKPLVNEFLTEMHKDNAPPSVVKSALKAYYNLQERQIIERDKADQDFKATSLNELQTEWGVDFRKNVNMVANLLSTAPDDIRGVIESSRTPDGKIFGDNPAIMKWFNQLAREVNPAAAVVPNAGSNAGVAMAEEKAAIEAKMGTGAYGAKERARYIEIVEAEEKIKSRAA